MYPLNYLNWAILRPYLPEIIPFQLIPIKSRYYIFLIILHFDHLESGLHKDIGYLVKIKKNLSGYNIVSVFLLERSSKVFGIINVRKFLIIVQDQARYPVEQQI